MNHQVSGPPHVQAAFRPQSSGHIRRSRTSRPFLRTESVGRNVTPPRVRYVSVAVSAPSRLTTWTSLGFPPAAPAGPARTNAARTSSPASGLPVRLEVLSLLRGDVEDVAEALTVRPDLLHVVAVAEHDPLAVRRPARLVPLAEERVEVPRLDVEHNQLPPCVEG